MRTLNGHCERRLVIKDGGNSQYGHSRDEPEILLFRDMSAAEVPGSSVRVINITKDRKHPAENDRFPLLQPAFRQASNLRENYSGPTNETVMTLKHASTKCEYHPY